MTSLTGQTVLVTGANRGMGREYVAQLLDRGVAQVFAAARDPQAVNVADARVFAGSMSPTRHSSPMQPRLHPTSFLINDAARPRRIVLDTPAIRSHSVALHEQTLGLADDIATVERPMKL